MSRNINEHGDALGEILIRTDYDGILSFIGTNNAAKNFVSMPYF